jgi:hypothetical protein
MVEVEVLVKTVEATRLTEESPEDASASFDVAASLAETDHQSGQFTLKYSITITSQPAIVKMDVTGTARITGDEFEIAELLKTSDKSTPPPVFMNIYQKVYAMFYLLSGSLKVPYPSPGLMKLVKMASPEEMGSSGSEEKAPAISA